MSDARFAIRCPRAFDPATGRLLSNHTVVVDGGRIAGITPDAATPPDLPVHTFDDATLLPGLVDAHVHLAISSDDYQIDFLKRSSAHNALQSLRAAQRMAAEGWTTLRVAGDADRHGAWLDVAAAIERGDFAGPRLVGAARYISPTGGGGDLNHCAAEHCLQGDGLIADGVDEIRKAVRRECKAGSQWIKVLLSGAFMSQGDDPRGTLYSVEEFEALVDEAHRWGRPVMVHAHGTDAIALALRTGVQSIEHGTWLDDATIELFVKTGTALVPTLAIDRFYRERYADSAAQAKMLRLLDAVDEMRRVTLGKAIAAGVEIVVGSDLGGYDDVRACKYEFTRLVELGMPPARALSCGTDRGARLLGLGERTGRLAEGFDADLFVCGGRPDEDIADVFRTRATWCRGRRQPDPV